MTSSKGWPPEAEPLPRFCTVTLSDVRGIRHVAEVNADSLFEAAVLALQAFKDVGWTEGIGPATRVDVEVRVTTTRHVVSVGQIQRWTEGAAVSPSDRLKRERLKAMLKEARIA
jgi:hypothetical protein